MHTDGKKNHGLCAYRCYGITWNGRLCAVKAWCILNIILWIVEINGDYKVDALHNICLPEAASQLLWRTMTLICLLTFFDWKYILFWPTQIAQKNIDYWILVINKPWYWLKIDSINISQKNQHLKGTISISLYQ